MFKGCINNFLFIVAVFCAGVANAENFREGQDYKKVSEQTRTSQDVQQLLVTDPDAVQVIFFFSYGCHGCNTMHTPFADWAHEAEKKYKSSISVYEYPVSFNAQWKMLAKLYYVANDLDPSGSLNDKIFTGLHKKGLRLWQESAMQKFFEQQGYSELQFKKAFKSFSIFQKVKRADEVSLAYGITLTPFVIVNGPSASYEISLQTVENSMPKFFEVLDYVVAREEQLIGKKKA